MKRQIIRTLIVLLSFAFSAASLWAQGAASPVGAYQQYLDALYRADPDQALAVITGRPDQIEFIRTFLDCLHASNEFREKYIATYGRAEWDKFGQDEPGANVPAFSLPGQIPPDSFRRLQKKNPIPRGSDYIVPQENGDMRIIQQDGEWYLVAESLGFEGQPAQYAILSAVLREYQTRIGAPGETAAGLRVAMKRAIRKTGQW
jgi:hypothetical protein